MNKKVSTYAELVQEKQRLQALLDAQQELIKLDLASLKEEIQPALDIASFAGKLVSRNGEHPLVNQVTDALIDTVVKKGLLGHSGWLSRLLLPQVLKNLSSHYIAGHAEEWVNKLYAFVESAHNGREKEQS